MSRDLKLAELAGELAGQADELFAAVALTLPTTRPAPSSRSRLLDALAPAWHRYEAAFASLIDLDVAQARAILDGAEAAQRWTDGPVNGVSLFHIDAGPGRAGADVGLVRLGAGVMFPPHAHLGSEQILMLDGGYLDSAGYELAAGSAEQRQVGAEHHFVAGPNGCVFAVVLYDGVAFPNPDGGPPIVYRG